jgi:hypothetical protein
LKTSGSLLHFVGSFDTNRLLLVRKPEELFIVLERLLGISEEITSKDPNCEIWRTSWIGRTN